MQIPFSTIYNFDFELSQALIALRIGLVGLENFDYYLTIKLKTITFSFLLQNLIQNTKLIFFPTLLNSEMCIKMSEFEPFLQFFDIQELLSVNHI